jgi:hypothetical protein
MLPIIVGVVIAIVAYIKPQCICCESRFTINEKCIICDEEVCSGCGMDTEGNFYHEVQVLPKGRFCKHHSKEVESNIISRKVEIDTERALIEKARDVTIYSKNYKGKTGVPKLSKVIETDFHDNKDFAELKLKMMAAKEGCVVVQNVDFIKDTESSGNFTYAVWKAKGVI